jgi:alpha-L-fucosidase 2
MTGTLPERLPSGIGIIAVVAVYLSGHLAAGKAEQPHVLWCDRTATTWTEALPIGNGRLGAMVYGEPRAERIALNEDTLYGGEPTPAGVRPIYQHVDTVFDLVKAGRFTEADRLVLQEMTGRLHQSYTKLGNLRLAMAHDDAVSDYQRELDLGSAVVRVTYRAHKATYVREVFASAVDQVIVVRITCDKRDSVSFTATMDTPHRFARLSTLSQDTIAVRARVD